MHKEVVSQVQSKCNMPTAMNMLKVSQIVMKNKLLCEAAGGWQSESVPDGASQSLEHCSPNVIVQQKKKLNNKHAGVK